MLKTVAMKVRRKVFRAKIHSRRSTEKLDSHKEGHKVVKKTLTIVVLRAKEEA